MRINFLILMVILTQLSSGFLGVEAKADNMSTFLKNCAYGTLAGAAVGLVSLTMSDDPGGRISNVARGASLGLYLGIGYGIYSLNRASPPEAEYSGFRSPRSSSGDSFFWLTPILSSRGIDSGARLHWAVATF